MQITDLLQENGVELAPSDHRHSREGWINVDCPFCGPGTSKFHLGYHVYTKHFNCWRCGFHSASETFSELFNIPYRQARDLTKQLSIDDVPQQFQERQHAKTIQLPSGLRPLLKPHKQYLKSRGFDPSELEYTWGIAGLGPLCGDLSWRIYIPINFHETEVSWTTRSISDATNPRYLTASPEQEVLFHKNLLYGEHLCTPGRGVIIHEGPIDVWTTGPRSVCTFGTNFTSSQVFRLSKYPIRVICFDRDARKSAYKLCDLLDVFPGKTEIIELETGKDPNSAKPREVQELRRMIRNDSKKSSRNYGQNRH